MKYIDFQFHKLTHFWFVLMRYCSSLVLNLVRMNFAEYIIKLSVSKPPASQLQHQWLESLAWTSFVHEEASLNEAIIYVIQSTKRPNVQLNRNQQHEGATQINDIKRL